MNYAYYNEIDPFCGQWLRNLIAANLIAPGEVDTRSIVDVRADDLRGFTQCHFFAGIGGWSYALRLAEWPDDRAVWTGSCPCQPFSAAGKQRGFDDERHLWPEFKRLIAERLPSIVFGEQVASATAWLRLVRSDLEAMDYAVGAIPFQAASAGADHLRDRFGFVAHRAQEREYGSRIARSGGRIARQTGLADADWQRGQINQDTRRSGEGSCSWQIAGPIGACDGDCRDLAHAASCRREPIERQPRICGEEIPAKEIPEFSDLREEPRSAFDWVIGADGKARRVKPGIRLLVDAFPNRVGLLRGFGNAIDPQAFKEFIGAVMECIP